MTPAEFLTLIRGAAKPFTSARTYRALRKGEATETLLTLHTSAGRFEALPYGGLQFAGGDDTGGTSIELMFPKLSVVIHGRQLAPVYEAIRTRTAAHLYEFNGDRHDPPEPGEPVIIEFDFSVEAKTKANAVP